MINEDLEWLIYLESNLHWGRIVLSFKCDLNDSKSANLFILKDEISF